MKLLRGFVIFICLSSLSYPCFSQIFHNLVPNPSFEIYDTCPDADGQISRAVGWKNICTPWCEYFNSCANGTNYGVPFNGWGNQFPYFGKGYSQISAHFTVITFREYLGSKLIKPLEPDIEYNVGFHVSLAERSAAASDQIGLLLTKDEILCPNSTYFTLDNYLPQLVSSKNFIITDTINWITVMGSFVAKGGEQYLTLGNFVINDSINWIFRHPWWSLWSEYYIDDVYVYDASIPTTANAGNDTLICQGDSLRLGSSNFADYQYLWSNNEGFSDTTGRPCVKPMLNTTYFLKQTNFMHEVSYDTVIVTVQECFEPLTIPNVFTPNGDGKNDKFEIINPGNYEYSLSIFNRWGTVVFSGDEKHAWDGRQNNQESSDGVFYYILRGRNTKYSINYSGVVHLLK